jgi:hypothetical protein
MTRGRLVAVTGLLLVLTAMLLVLLDPSNLHHDPSPSVWPSLLAGAGALLLLAAAWLERGALRRALAARQTRFGAFAAAYTLLVLIALAALAFLVERQTWRFDLTHDGSASLSEDSLRVLRMIPADGEAVEVVGFTGGGALTAIDRAAAEGELIPLFELMQRHSPLIDAKLADASREPALAGALGIARVPSVAVRWQAPGEDQPRVVRTDLLSEDGVLRTVEQALLGTTRPAYLVHGHGELSPIDIEGTGGFFFATKSIAADNYDVRPLNLIEAGAVPEDAELVIIAGPATDFVRAETDALTAHARAGGRFLMLLGPVFTRDVEVAEQPVLHGWLRETFGVELGSSVVCDLDGLSGPGADLRHVLIPPVANAPHPILRGRDRQLVMPFARPVRLAKPLPVGVAGELLFSSGSRSWAEADTPARPVFDPADVRGPHGLAAALSSKPYDQERAARLVIVGSHAFGDNSWLPRSGNSTFLPDTAAWLNEREAVLDARRTRGRDGTAVIPYKQGMLILLCAASIPLVLAATGVLIWWQRRRL